MIFNELDKWANIANYFQCICKDVEHLTLETKEDSLVEKYFIDDPDVSPDFIYKHESIIPFRKSDDRKLLEEQLEIVRSLIPHVQTAIEARELTTGFLGNWGRLNYAVGCIMCAWFARDSDDLRFERSGRKSGAVRRKDKEQCFVASNLLPLLEAGKTRKEAERIFVAKLQEAIKDGREIPPLSLAEMTGLLKDKALRPTYGEKKLTKKKMKGLLAKPDPVDSG